MAIQYDPEDPYRDFYGEELRRLMREETSPTAVDRPGTGEIQTGGQPFQDFYRGEEQQSATAPPPVPPQAAQAAYQAPMLGFDFNPQSEASNNIKYVVGRLLRGLEPTEANLRTVFDQLRGQGRDISLLGRDNLLLNETGGEGYIGIRPEDRNVPGSNPVWQWMAYNNEVRGPQGEGATVPQAVAGQPGRGGVQGALAAGISQQDIDRFLQANPGDEGRIMEALGGGRGTPGGITARGPAAAPASTTDRLTQFLMDQITGQQRQRQAFEDSVRNQILQLMNQGPLNYDQLLNSPEAQGFRRVSERATERLRGRAAESRGIAGTGQNQFGEVGGALGADIQGGEQQLQEQLAGMEAQLVARELQARRDQLMQALSLGAGILGRDQETALRKELQEIDVSLRRELGMGSLGLGLLSQLQGNQLSYDQLGLQAGQYGAENNLRALQLLLGQ